MKDFNEKFVIELIEGFNQSYYSIRIMTEFQKLIRNHINQLIPVAGLLDISSNFIFSFAACSENSTLILDTPRWTNQYWAINISQQILITSVFCEFLISSINHNDGRMFSSYQSFDFWYS